MGTSFRGAYGQHADADAKGKGIMYEEDDDEAPIQLVDRDESYVIKEAGFTLIGKILNPKKQDVEKLLQTMPSQWGLAERITANDLGNGKFLFNFESEDDIKHGYCPTTDIRLRLQTQPVRPDVFSRVQNDQEQPRSQYASRDYQSYAPNNHQPLLLNKRDRLRQPATLDFPSVHNTRAGYNEYRQARYREGEDNSHYGKHSDRIIRRKREYSISDRYGDARAWKGPYDRNVAKAWKPKRRETIERDNILGDGKENTRRREHGVTDGGSAS
ncbi:DUF4283 domain-containing protein [Raphanus sativus]|nr:DUF4283 domain-containing protein [Raphanus sativus]